MTEAIRQWALGAAGAGVFCAVAMELCPSGRVKKILALVCGAVMALALLEPLRGFDAELYSRTVSEYRLRADMTKDSAGEFRDELSRTIIEDKCAAYILDKAESLGLGVSSASVLLKWSAEGYWYPYEARLGVTGDGKGYGALQDSMEAELGIPRERQYLNAEGG